MVGRTIYTTEIGKHYKSSSVGGCFFQRLVCSPLISCFAAEFSLLRSEPGSEYSADKHCHNHPSQIHSVRGYHISGTLTTFYHCAEQVKTKVQPTICLYTSFKASICLEEGTHFSKSLKGTHRAMGAWGGICSPVSIKRATFS